MKLKLKIIMLELKLKKLKVFFKVFMEKLKMLLLEEIARKWFERKIFSRKIKKWLEKMAKISKKYRGKKGYDCVFKKSFVRVFSS